MSDRIIGALERHALYTAPFEGFGQHYYVLYMRGADTIAEQAKQIETLTDDYAEGFESWTEWYQRAKKAESEAATLRAVIDEVRAWRAATHGELQNLDDILAKTPKETQS